MRQQSTARVLDYEGRLAPPRRNGELLFNAVWESRVFGLTMLLYEAGAFGWDEFRARLITTIAARESAPAALDYWACWLDAFEALLADKQLCAASALGARVRELEARPVGHDHQH